MEQFESTIVYPCGCVEYIGVTDPDGNAIKDTDCEHAKSKVHKHVINGTPDKPVHARQYVCHKLRQRLDPPEVEAASGV